METAARKPIEHFIHSMNNLSRNHNLEITHYFKTIRLTSKFDKYNGSCNTLVVTAIDDVISFKMERYHFTATELKSRTGTINGYKQFSIVNLMSKNVFLNETKIGHYSKTLIWRRWFPLQFVGVLVLSFKYYIQSIKAYHWSNKHSKCQIWSIGDIFINLWRHMVTS